jgi:hypothetical protein
MPKLPASHGEIADQLVKLSLRLKTESIPDAVLKARHELVLEHWKKVSDSNLLLEKIHDEMMDNALAIRDMESDYKALEQKGEFGASFITCVRNLRQLEAKHADLIRRIDALAMVDAVAEVPVVAAEVRPKSHKKAK